MLSLLLQELRHRWFETLLCVVAIASVSAVLIAQRAVDSSADGKIHDLAHRLGKNMLVVPGATDLTRFYTHRHDDGATLPEKSVATLRASPLSRHFGMIAARLYGNVTVKGVPLVVVGERVDRGGGSPDSLAPGQADLTPLAARRLAVGPGARLVVGGGRVQVTRVMSRAPDGLGSAMFVSLPTAQRLLGQPGAVSSLRLAGCWCSLDVPALGAKVERLLPGAQAITVAGVLEAQKGTVAVVRRYAIAARVAGLALVGATILMLMASQARRRVRELGLLLAIGATPSTVRRLFVAKAALIGLAGGIAGYLLGFPVATRLGQHFLGGSVAPPKGMLLPVLGLCVLVSVAAAYLPARWAARTDPVQVLREE